jgi:hypothetical protein
MLTYRTKCPFIKGRAPLFSPVPSRALRASVAQRFAPSLRQSSVWKHSFITDAGPVLSTAREPPKKPRNSLNVEPRLSFETGLSYSARYTEVALTCIYRYQWFWRPYEGTIK